MRSTRRMRYKPLAEINVVPYIDVMLVLLVIFMITTPLLSEGVDVDLPQAATREIKTQAMEPLVITVDKQGQYFLSTAAQPKTPMQAEQMIEQIQLQRSANPHTPVYVRGDQAVAYGEVVKVMARLQSVGIDKVGLMTRPAAQA